MRKNKRPSPPKSGQNVAFTSHTHCTYCFPQSLPPFPKKSFRKGKCDLPMAFVRRSSCGWNAVDPVDSNIASLKEQSARGPWDVLLDLAEKELHSWVWGSGMKRASPEWMWVVQCSQVGAGRGSVLSSSLCSHGPVRLALPSNSKSQNPTASSMSLRLWWNPSGSFPDGFTPVVSQSFLSTFPSLTSGLGTLNHWKSHLHNSIRR